MKPNIRTSTYIRRTGPTRHSSILCSGRCARCNPGRAIPRPFALLLAVSLFATLPAAAPGADVVDGIAAVVNGEVITYSAVQDLVAGRERALAATYSGEELMTRIKELRLEALKDLIDRTLIVQDFKEQGFKLPDYLVDSQIDAIIREEFGDDKEAFLKTLMAQGFTLAKFRKLEEEKLIVQAMRARNVKGSFIASPARIEAYYRENKEQFRTPEQIKLRMITIYKGDDLSAENNKRVAEEIRTKIDGSEDFERMALMYSEDSMREDGGDWGWIDRGTLNDDLTAIAFGLKTGVVSETIDGGDAYYIMMVEERQEAVTKPLDDIRDEIEQKIVQVQRQEAIQKWIDRLRDKAYIKMF